MPSPLDSTITAIRADRGLAAGTPGADITGGIAATRDLNRVLLQMIDQTNVNDDGRITGADMKAISDALWRPVNAQPWREFYVAHGNDNGTVETGYHLVQDDGGTLEFQGRNFLDTVLDAIYHFGFRIQDGAYFNEDGNTNQETADVAGWLNFFLNGENIVYGDGGPDVLGSGDYSSYFAAARNETFLAGSGADSIWADVGNDKVYGGMGDDRSGGGDGNDRMWGEDGRDAFFGEGGRDSIHGGNGADELGGGLDDDTVYGDAGRDTLYGQEGRDRLFGGAEGDRIDGGDLSDTVNGGDGWDDLSGGDGRDFIAGGTGRDTLSGNEGSDVLRGGKDADLFRLWETAQSRDTLVFAPGDSGRTQGQLDVVEGFEVGTDKIDLTAFGKLTVAQLDFTGGGKGSVYFDGDYLRIDANGDRATDMIIEFMYVNALTAGDFILA